MTVDAVTFDLGGFPLVSLSLVSSDGLAPLPMPLEGSVEKFRQFMEGGEQQQADVGRGLAAIAQGLVERPEATDAPVAVEKPETIDTPAVVEKPETTDTPAVVKRPETIDASRVSRPTSQDSRLVSDVSRPDSRPLPAAYVPRETQRVVESPRAIETPTVVETPRVVESPRVVETPTVVESPRAVETPTVVEAPRVAEATVVAEAPTVAEKPIPRVTPAPLAPRVAEVVVESPIPGSLPTPAADVPRETPTIVEAPHVAEAPVVAEAPRVAETPVVAEAPSVVAEKPIPRVTPDPLAPRVTEVVVESPIPGSLPTPAADVPRETPTIVEAPHVAEAPVVAEAPTVAEAPVAVEKPVSHVTPDPLAPRVAEARNIPQEGVDMRIEATTIELRGNPPVKVQILSSAGLAPLPIPRTTATRFAAAMEDDARGTETPLVHSPLVAPPPLDAGAVARPSELAASAASARTEAIVETVNEIVETVVDRISVTPTLAQGEGEIRITLRPTVLDGSTVSLSAKDGELTVVVAPATPDAAHLASAALPRLEAALAAHAPAFHHVAVVLATSKKGKSDEIA